MLTRSALPKCYYILGVNFLFLSLIPHLVLLRLVQKFGVLIEVKEPVNPLLSGKPGPEPLVV